TATSNKRKNVMNWLKYPFREKKIIAPEVPVKANPDWHTYRAGEGDKTGRTIKEIYALKDKYVIYFADHIYSADHVGCKLSYETEPGLVIEGLGKADAALAGINRLL